MTRYVCYFKIDELTKTSTDIPDIATAQHGFWVDGCFEYTTGSDCEYWIPPGAVLYVQKEWS